jgi:hypothetical protein
MIGRMVSPGEIRGMAAVYSPRRPINSLLSFLQVLQWNLASVPRLMPPVTNAMVMPLPVPVQLGALGGCFLHLGRRLGGGRRPK